MIAKTGVQVVRVKTMADNSKRVEIDFGESIKLSSFDDLLGTTISVIIVPDRDDIYPLLEQFANELSNIERNRHD